jgi:hypothetical protein
VFSKTLKIFSCTEHIRDVFLKYGNNPCISRDHPGTCGRLLRESLHETGRKGSGRTAGSVALTAVTLKSPTFWVGTPCMSSERGRLFGVIYRLNFRVEK